MYNKLFLILLQFSELTLMKLTKINQISFLLNQLFQ